MKVKFDNKNLTSSNDEVFLFKSNTQEGTIIKSLQLINGARTSTVHIIRADGNDNEYADIRVDLKANDYLIVWEGFFVLPYNHSLKFKCSSSTGCTLVANIVSLGS